VRFIYQFIFTAARMEEMRNAYIFSWETLRKETTRKTQS